MLPVWTTLAQRATDSYGAIERSSSIQFHHPVGHLRMGLRSTADDDDLNTAESIGQTLDAPVERLPYRELVRQFPFFNLPATVQGLYERGGAASLIHVPWWRHSLPLRRPKEQRSYATKPVCAPRWHDRRRP